MMTCLLSIFPACRYFNMKKPIFLLILLDSLVSLAGSLVLTAVIAVFLAERYMQQQPLQQLQLQQELSPSTSTSAPAGADSDQYSKCTVFFVGLYFPAHTGLAFTALIAIFRSGKN